MHDISAVKASGGKGWLAWCEPVGQFDVDPYHGSIPRVVTAYGVTASEAVGRVRSRLDA